MICTAAIKREREDRGPQERVAERGAGDRIGRDAGWVVIRGAGNQSGAEIRKEPAEAALQDKRASGGLRSWRVLAQSPPDIRPPILQHRGATRGPAGHECGRIPR